MSTSSSELRRIATRYVAALFALASEKKQLDGVKTDLDAVGAALADSEDFSRLLASPVMTRDEQAAGVDAVLNKAKASKLTRDFFRTLAENRRLEVTPFVVELFAEKLAESRDETTAEITSAYKLTAAQVKKLTTALKKATGRKEVHVVTKEDPSILGGVIVKVDGKMFDNSIASKISRLASGMKVQVQA